MLLYPFLDKIAPIVVLVHLLFLFALGTVGHQLLVLLPGRVLRRKCFRERPPGDVALSADVNTSACEQFLLRKLLEQLRAFVSRRDVPDALPRKRRAGRKVFLNKTAQQKEAKRGGSSDVCKKRLTNLRVTSELSNLYLLLDVVLREKEVSLAVAFVSLIEVVFFDFCLNIHLVIFGRFVVIFHSSTNAGDLRKTTC